jgi:hypothetical protein
MSETKEQELQPCLFCESVMPNELGTNEIVSNDSVIRESQWTTKIPTEEGWYWLQDRMCGNYYDFHDPSVHKISRAGGRLQIQLCGGKGDWLDDFCNFWKRHKRVLYWQKIPVPELPKGGDE